MGTICFAMGATSGVVASEFQGVASASSLSAAFLLARLARVARLGLDEAEGDEVVGESGFFWFQHGSVGVVYRASKASSGADVTALTFSNLKSEKFSAALDRGRKRNP